MSRHVRITGALVGLVALVLFGWLLAGPGSPGGDPGTGTATTTAAVTSAPASPVTSAPTGPGVAAGARALSELPPQVAQTWRLIEAGGPFEHEQDGGTFGNRERLLPERPRGHYREYTVPTPGEDDRGARRLVTGADGELYYTADHYSSFVRVDPNR